MLKFQHDASAEAVGPTPLKVMPSSWIVPQKGKSSEQHPNQWLIHEKWEPGERPAGTCIEQDFNFFFPTKKISKLNMQGHTLGSDARDWVMANIKLLWSNTASGISPQKHWLIWDGVSSSQQRQMWLFSKTSTSELGLMKMQWKITRVRTSFLITTKPD